MVSSLDRDLRRFKQQSELLSLLIQARGPEKWEANTYIMRNGKLTNVGGERMPKDRPASITLTPEQAAAFRRSGGAARNLKELNQFLNQLRLLETPKEPIPVKNEGEATFDRDSDTFKSENPKGFEESKSLIDSAMELINGALGAIGDKITAIGDWVSPKITALKTNIGSAIGALGTAATTAYTGVTGAFSAAIEKAKQAVADYKKDPKKFKTELKRNIGEMANQALENIKGAPGKAMNAVAGGVVAAMTAISNFLNNLAFPKDTDKSLGENIQTQLVAMVSKLNLSPEKKNEVLKTIQDANLADAEIPSSKSDKETQAKDNAAIAETLGRAWEKQYEASRSDVDPSNPTYQLLLKLRIPFAEDMLHDGLFQTAQLTELQKRIDKMGDLPQDELRRKIMEEILDIKENEYNRIDQQREERNARLEAEYERNKQVQEQR